MVVDKHSHIVGVGDGTMRDVWASSLAMHVNAGATERGVCEVAVVDKWLTLFWNSQTIFSHVGGVVWGIKLKRGREEREGGKGGKEKEREGRRERREGKRERGEEKEREGRRERGREEGMM